MFELTVSPIWVLCLILFAAFIGMMAPKIVEEIVRTRRKNVDASQSWSTWSLISGLVIAIAICLIAIFTGMTEKNTTINNPLQFDHSETNGALAYTVDQSGFEKTLMEETGVEGVIINNNNDAKKTFEHLQQGKFINFEGIKENSRIEGSVYFSENSMVILMDDKGDFENKIVVPTK